MSKYIPATEVAKMIRKDLKRAFPEVKFSVITRHSSVIDIKWVDGPTADEVDALTQCFRGANFDGMIDLETSVTHIIDGEEIQYGSKYIFAVREYSAAFLQHMIDYVVADYHFDSDPGFMVIISQYSGDAYIDCQNRKAHFGTQYAKDFVMRLAQDVNAANMPAIPVKEAQAEAEAVPASDETEEESLAAYYALLDQAAAKVPKSSYIDQLVGELYQGSELDEAEEETEEEYQAPRAMTASELTTLWRVQDEQEQEVTPSAALLKDFEAESDLFEQVASLPVPEETQQALERLASRPAPSPFNSAIQAAQKAQEKASAQKHFIQHIALMELDAMTPLEALTHLYTLKREAAQLGKGE